MPQADSETPVLSSVQEPLERLLAYEPGTLPVISLYLNTQADKHGRDPRYAALLTDANSARIFVFGLGQTLETEQVKGKKVHRVKVGGWSQARYQRRAQNAHQSHAKDAVEVLDRIVREEDISYI
ncbi:MAG: hypothetical protein H7039_18045 [Bryobacteraceae bacterium]|nr:hypothetical protein [Bryobacteraceae bacterium]